MSRPRVQQIETADPSMPNYHQISPSSSISSLSSSDVVFSQPALAANRDNDLVIDLDTDEESYSGSAFTWPTVESPAAHHTSPLRPARRTPATASSETSRNSQPASATPATSNTTTTASDRRRYALTIALNREAEQAADPSTTLARRIAARESARTSSSSSPQDQHFPTARLLSRTTISVAEPEPPADLRRLATTREAERQLHYRDWHRLGLLDPSTSVAGSDGAGISPGRFTPPMAYARRRSSAATTRTFPLSSDNNDGQEEDADALSMDIAQRLRRRMATLDALESISDSQLEREREHDPSGPLPSASSSIRTLDRYMARIRAGLGNGRAPEWEDGRDDPNGERIFGDNGLLTTPAGRSRYWNALSNAATDDLLALATERSNRSPPTHPPGLINPAQQQPASAATKSKPADPLPNPLGTMLLPTPKQRFKAAFYAS